MTQQRRDAWPHGEARSQPRCPAGPNARATRRGLMTRGAAAAAVIGSAAGAGLAGCTGGSSQSPANSESLTLSKTPVTIRALVRAGTDGHVRWFKQQTPTVFQPQHPTITVQFEEVTGGSIAEKLLVLAAGDSVPDIVWLGVVADGGRGGITKGILRPLDSTMKADKFNPNAFWKSALDMFSYQGQIYGIPRAGHYGCHVAYVNQDLAKRAGIRVPVADGNWTTDDLIAWAKTLTRADAEQWGFQPNVGMNECGIAWLRTFGGDLFSADGKKLLLDTAEAQAGLQYMYDTRFKHQTNDNLRANSRNLFQTGKLAIIQATPGLVAQYSAPNQQFVKFEWAATILPKQAATGKRGTQFGGGALSIARQSKSVAEAWEWMKFITGKDNGVLQVAGGAGSPGARDDVWSDPRLAQISPVYGLIQKTYKTPGPTYLPWNETYFDVMALVNGKLNDFWNGNAALRETVQTIQRDGAALLEKPAA